MNVKIEELPEAAAKIAKNLAQLQEGNKRYVAGTTIHNGASHAARRRQLASGQSPFAVVLGCSDSRVPVELVFDQGLGDLFVLRVAGNLVDALQIASVEFAVQKFGANLIVVLGHTKCGAVDATIDAIANHCEHGENCIVDHVRPAIADLIEQGLRGEELITEAVHCNTEHSAQELIDGSSLIRELSEQGQLAVVSAEYDLDTGLVDFLHEPATEFALAADDSPVLTA